MSSPFEDSLLESTTDWTHTVVESRIDSHRVVVCGPTTDHRFTTNSTDPVETGESDSELVLTRWRPVLIMSHGRLRIS